MKESKIPENPQNSNLESLGAGRDEIDRLRIVFALVILARYSPTLVTDPQVWQAIEKLLVQAEIEVLETTIHPAKMALGMPVEDPLREKEALDNFLRETGRLGIPEEIAIESLQPRIEGLKRLQESLRSKGIPKRGRGQTGLTPGLVPNS